MKIKKSHLRLLIRRSLIKSRLSIQEGPHDPGRFKAIFMAGCPGSGKGTVLTGIFGTSSGTTHHGLKIVNPDDLYELLLTKSGLPLSQPDLPEDSDDLKAYQSAAGSLQYRAGMKTTGGSKGISPSHVGLDVDAHGYNPAKKQRGKTRLENYVSGGLGLIIDGTASNYEKISREKRILEDLGYSTMMIAVNVPVDIALKRNRQRGEQGKRSIHPGAVKATCEKLIPSLSRYRNLFGGDYIEIDNTLPIDQTLSGDVLAKVNRFISTPPSSTSSNTRSLDPNGDKRLSPDEIRDIANDIENQNS